MNDHYQISSDRTTAVSTETYWKPMSTAPLGVKIQVLNLGNVATFTVLSEKERGQWLGWYPMLKISKLQN
jgi:hypothetical protein